MNPKQLSRIVSKETGFPAYQVESILKSAFAIMRASILKGHKIKIRGIMSIFIDIRQAKNNYDLKSRKMVQIPRRFVLKIIPSIDLKKEVNEKKTY